MDKLFVTISDDKLIIAANVGPSLKVGGGGGGDQ